MYAEKPKAIVLSGMYIFGAHQEYSKMICLSLSLPSFPRLQLLAYIGMCVFLFAGVGVLGAFTLMEWYGIVRQFESSAITNPFLQTKVENVRNSLGAASVSRSVSLGRGYFV
jgi:hypothetical protein